MAGKVKRSHQIRYGSVVMGTVSIANHLLNLASVPHVAWALLPVAIYSFGSAMMMVPVVTLMVLDLVPQRRGMASSRPSSAAPPTASWRVWSRRS